MTYEPDEQGEPDDEPMERVDLAPAGSAQRQVLDVVQVMPRGNTAIDNHPRCDEIREAFVVYALAKPIHKPALTEFLTMLREETGLSLTETTASAYLAKYVTPYLFMKPQLVRRQLVDAGLDLNTARQKGEVLKAMREEFDMALMAPEERVSHEDKIRMGRHVIKGVESFEESLERFEVVPRRRTDIAVSNVKLDINRLQESLHGRRKGQTIDIEGHEVADGT